MNLSEWKGELLQSILYFYSIIWFTKGSSKVIEVNSSTLKTSVKPEIAYGLTIVHSIGEKVTKQAVIRTNI